MDSGVSQDAAAPKGGPPFSRLNAWPYRVEMLAFTVGLVAYLVWRALTHADVDVLWTLFWFLWPDLGSFIPLGLAARGGSAWPSWGSGLYNALHTFLVWLPVFVLASFWLGSPSWPLLGWAVHITMDRAVGYYLRAQSAPAAPRVS